VTVPSAHAETVSFRVPREWESQRLDRILPALEPRLSRSAAADLIAAGEVRVNGRSSKAATRPIEGAWIEIDVPAVQPAKAMAEQIALSVVYEDDDLVVVDKPAGMVVHPAPGNQSGTLVNALLGRYAGLPGDPARPGIVHRLDKDTSGLIVVARSAQALASLAAAFKQREVHKEYLALVLGTLDPPSGVISADVGRDPRFRQRMAVVATGGRQARTRYATVEYFRHFSLLRVVLETGRTHQIRVHFSALGHPVAGDPVYGRIGGKLPLDRQFLHAALLRFRHPRSGESMEFVSPLPDDLDRALEALRERQPEHPARRENRSLGES
jgi:23S rRNA pseudouridine1911/1915/1917 synthase